MSGQYAAPLPWTDRSPLDAPLVIFLGTMGWEAVAVSLATGWVFCLVGAFLCCSLPQVPTEPLQRMDVVVSLATEWVIFLVVAFL